MKGAADQRASATLETATKPSVDKKHFEIREDKRETPVARARTPSPPARERATTAKPSATKSRGAAVIRASFVLLVGASIGYLCSYLFPAPAHLSGQEIAKAPSDRSAATLTAFVDQGERQIAEHRLETPAGDNALETYRRIAAKSLESTETRSFGEHLSLAFWSLGVAATQRGDWVEATRYFDIVKTLPIPRTSLVSAETSPLEPAPVLDLPHAVVPKLAAEGAAAANGPSSPARAMAAANDEHAWDAALVALRRGDQSLRLGDIISARRFYEFAAASGITEAATALGQTYDPAYLKSAGVRGVKANPETARGWYEKAARQGDARAAQLLQSLEQN
ncbi:MAG TPA: hypothetical protein VGU20_23540 [Stellaceae bacterium]|nr:hypothetical protein [Stellaceae bacterium]